MLVKSWGFEGDIGDLIFFKEVLSEAEANLLTSIFKKKMVWLKHVTFQKILKAILRHLMDTKFTVILKEKT